jgi:hypothetical protein
MPVVYAHCIILPTFLRGKYAQIDCLCINGAVKERIPNKIVFLLEVKQIRLQKIIPRFTLSQNIQKDNTV